ncbi:molybdenum cofactor biosynthesis protein MoaE [Agromyces silvae]|uniref:molybdenum cofactor biosynthesis protein MoaE n=1 Tax=Agromyces silvae TaxID=3388266 RepID=UPI00280B513E|nr:molybdenum cofactor biosynthesis protein MoaE [Agromyces protaetiae]
MTVPDAPVSSAVSAEPLDLASHLAAVSDPHAGAIANFVGVVRDHDPAAGGRVILLEYQAHPDAGRILEELATRFATDGARVAVSHRVGRLGVGDLALVCAVSTAHRADAFDRCRALVEAIKAELPIWKRQHTADGDATWVGLS